MSSINESDIFEENTLYISGITLKNNLEITFEHFQSLFDKEFKEYSNIKNSEIEDILNIIE